MGIGRKKELKIEVANDFTPLIPMSEDDEGQMDLSKIEVVTGILPIAGVMQRDDGTLVPTLFLRLEGVSADGKKTQHVFGWNPMALANAANLLNAMSLMLISDPEPLVKEIAQSMGIANESTPTTKKFEGYL